MSTSVISIKDLTKNFGSFCALDGLNLEVEKNTCVGLLGPNGAGKSTLIKLITSLIHPTKGTAEINGQQISKSKNALKEVGVLVETPEFFPYLNPRDVLNYFGRLHEIPQEQLGEKINQSLKMVGLENVSQKKIGQFSKGMKQRLGLAAALLHDPSILILDEPTSGFDPKGRVEFLEIFRSYLRDGKTILISSHQLSEIQEICDTIVILDKGKLVGVKKLNQVQTNEKKIEIRLQQGLTDEQIHDITTLEGVQTITHSDKLVHIKFDGSIASVSLLLKNLDNVGLKIISFNVSVNDLQEMYLDNVSDSIR